MTVGLRTGHGHEEGQPIMKQRLIAAFAVFAVGFGVGLGATYALLSKKPTAPGADTETAAADDLGPESGDAAAGNAAPDPRAPGAAKAAPAAAPAAEPAVAEAGVPAVDEAGAPAAAEAGGAAPTEAANPAEPGAGASDAPTEGVGAVEPAADPGRDAPPGTVVTGAGVVAPPAEEPPAAAEAPPAAPEPPAVAAPTGVIDPKAAPANWWEGLAGKRCKVDLGRVKVLTIREGELKDGEVVDWKARFGNRPAVGRLFQEQEAIVTVLGVATDSVGNPVAAKIEFERQGKRLTGIIALHAQGLRVSLHPVQ